MNIVSTRRENEGVGGFGELIQFPPPCLCASVVHWCVFLFTTEARSETGLPHSKTLSRLPRVAELPQTRSKLPNFRSRIHGSPAARD